MLKALFRAATPPIRVGVSDGPDGPVVAAVERGASARPRLHFCSHRPAAEDGGGEPLAELMRAHGVARAPVSMLLDPRDYELVLVETPDVLPAELRAAVRWRIKDLINFHLDDAVIDVFEIPGEPRRGKARMTYAVAARAQAVRRSVAFAKPAGTLDVIDIPELALRNVAALLPEARQGVALLVASEQASELVLVREESLYLARRIELALPAEELAAALALEVQRSLDHYESQFDRPPIAKLYVAALDAGQRSLAGAIRREIGLEASPLDLAPLFEGSASDWDLAQPRALHAIGAALRHEPVLL